MTSNNLTTIMHIYIESGDPLTPDVSIKTYS